MQNKEIQKYQDQIQNVGRPIIYQSQEVIGGNQNIISQGSIGGDVTRKSVVITSQNYSTLEERQKIVLLSTEVERLYKMNKKLREELASFVMNSDQGNVYVLQEDTWKLQFSNLQANFDSLQEQYNLIQVENANLKNELGKVTREKDAYYMQLGEFRKQIEIMMGERDRMFKEMENYKAQLGRLFEFEQKLIQLSTENNRLNELVNTLTAQNQELGRKAANHEKEHGKMAGIAKDKGSENEQLKLIMENLKRDNENLSRLLMEKSREIETLRGQLGALSQIESLKLTINNLQRENENLNRILVERSKEIEALRSQVMGFQQQGSQIEGLKITIMNLQRENENLNRNLVDRSNEAQKQISILINEKEKMAREIEMHKARGNKAEELEKQLIQVSTECQRLILENQKLQPVRIEVESLKGLVENYKKEIENLNRVLMDKSKEIEGLKGQLVVITQIESLKLTIQNLQKENENLNRILVDRSREIDGLRIQITNLQQATGQIEGLKVTITNLQRENENLNRILVDRSKEIENLRGQLVALQQIESLKMTVTNLQRENENLNRILVERTNEFQKQISTIIAERDKLIRELETVRSRARRVDELEKQLIQISTECQRLAIENQKLIDEINKLRGDVNVKSALHDEAQKKAKSHEDNHRKMAAIAADKANEVEALKAEVERLKGQLEPLKLTVQNIQRDNENLNRLLVERTKEIEELRRQLSLLQVNLNQAESLKIQIQNLQRENENLSKTYIARINELEAINSQLYHTSQDASLKIVLLAAELERLQSKLELYIRLGQDLEEWKKKYFALDSQRIRELEELQMQFEAYKRNNIGSDAKIKWEAERAAYETSILQLRTKIDDLNAQLKFYTGEGERNSVAIRQSTVELETIKKQRYEIELRYQQEISDLKAQLEQYRSNSLDARQLAIKYNSEKAADQSQIRQLQQLNDNLKAELEKVYELMNQRKAEYDNVAKQNDTLRRSYVEVTKVLKEKDSTIIEGSENELMRRRINELETTIDEYRKTAERNSIELSRKNKELVDKIQELDMLKMKYEESINNYQNLNSQLFSKLMNENRQLKYGQCELNLQDQDMHIYINIIKFIINRLLNIFRLYQIKVYNFYKIDNYEYFFNEIMKY